MEHTQQRTTDSGRTNTPYSWRHLKYRLSPTEPSFFPTEKDRPRGQNKSKKKDHYNCATMRQKNKNRRHGTPHLASSAPRPARFREQNELGQHTQHDHQSFCTRGVLGPACGTQIQGTAVITTRTVRQNREERWTDTTPGRTLLTHSPQGRPQITP